MVMELQTFATINSKANCSSGGSVERGRNDDCKTIKSGFDYFAWTRIVPSIPTTIKPRVNCFP